MKIHQVKGKLSTRLDRARRGDQFPIRKLYKSEELGESEMDTTGYRKDNIEYHNFVCRNAYLPDDMVEFTYGRYIRAYYDNISAYSRLETFSIFGVVFT